MGGQPPHRPGLKVIGQLSRLPRGFAELRDRMCFVGHFHRLIEQRIEFTAGGLNFILHFKEELPLIPLDRTIREHHRPQPRRFLRIDAAIYQHVIAKRTVIKVLEGGVG